MSKLTYKQKYQALWLILGVCLVLFYVKGIKPVLHLYEQNANDEAKVKQLENAPYNIAKLEQELLNYNDLLTTKTNELTYDHILEVLNTFCEQHGIQITTLTSPHEYNNEEYVLATFEVSVSGSFEQLLMLSKFIEDNMSMARVVSSQYYTTEHIQSRVKTLFCKIYIQYVKEEY
jgi:hypothetical protein